MSRNKIRAIVEGSLLVSIPQGITLLAWPHGVGHT